MYDPKDKHRYDDMLDLPHHTSAVHPRMPMLARAAQFAPFAALTGYSAVIAETGRLTKEKIILAEDERLRLNGRMALLKENLTSAPQVNITYFVKDALKSGGEYVTVSGSVKRLDEYRQRFVMADDTVIPFDDIIALEGELFAALDGLY